MDKIYELTLVLPEDITEKGAKSLLEGLLQKTGGEIKAVDFWGVRELAYPIKKKTRGMYFLFDLVLTAKQVLDLGMRLKQSEDILRHLLVTKK